MAHLFDSKKLRVKFICTNSRTAAFPDLWLRQFPGQVPEWGNCRFIFDIDARDYDWLVVYSDLPRFPPNYELLACARGNTLLVTTEPSSIKSYGRDYAAQFGLVLTSQAEWALPHPGRIFSQPALHWYYGFGKARLIDYDQMVASPPLNKSHDFSTVCSSKQQRHTLHKRRYQFTQEIKKRVPSMEIYGHGVRAMDDKAETLDPYRYHLAIENYIGPHHWTEKLADAFLGVTLPFYCGCTNAADYFPPESFIPLDIDDVEGSAAIIQRSIRDGEYEKRLPAILEARRLVLECYNIFAVLAREIEARELLPRPAEPCRERIYSIREMRKLSPLVSLRHLYEKIRLKVIHSDNFFK